MGTTNKLIISALRKHFCFLIMICTSIISMAASSDIYIHAAIENLQSQLDSLPDFKAAKVKVFEIDKDVIAVVFYPDADAGSFSEKDTLFSFFPDSYAEVNNRLYFWVSDDGQKGDNMLTRKMKQYGIIDNTKGSIVVCGWGELPMYLMRKDDVSLYIFMNI